MSYKLCPDEDASDELKELKGNGFSQPMDLEGDVAEKGGLLRLSSHDSTQAMHVKKQDGQRRTDEASSAFNLTSAGRRRRGEEASNDAHICAS